MKFIRKLALTFILIILAFLLVKQLNIFPSIGNLFKSKPILIQNTPLIIENIKDLKQLITLQSYDEVVVTKQANNYGSFFNNLITEHAIPSSIKKVGIIEKGSVYAGIDVSQITENEIQVIKDSISIKIPKAQIFDVIVNPSDTEIFIEEGNWDITTINSIKEEGKTLLKERAITRKILENAQQRGALVIENFLRSIGFKKITISTTTYSN